MALSGSAAALVMDVSSVEPAEIDVSLVPLQHPLADRRELGAAVLDPAVGAVQAELDLQLEVADLLAPPDQEAVQLHHLLGRGLAHDLAVLDAPEGRVAVPPVQRLAVEDRNKAGVVVRLRGRKHAACLARRW